MKKIFFVLTVFIFNAFFAYGGELITENTTNGCISNLNRIMLAMFEPNEYSCASGYYLPANATACASCLTGYTCTGGTYPFNANANQGINLNTLITTNIDFGCDKNFFDSKIFLALFESEQYTCNAGYYLPADGIECVQCPANNACAGGTYNYSETTTQGIVACDVDTYSPTGSAVCYQHILHVGNDNIYLRSTKQTTPSLNIQIGNDIFYANMTTVPTYMNKDSSHYLHILYEGDDYYVCDDTTYVAPVE